MYQRKTPKTQQPYKSVYIGHNPHTIPLTRRKWSDRIRVISIDPGTTHYAIRVEERNIRGVGPITTLHFNKIGLKKDDQELSSDLVCPVYSFVANYLDNYLDLFKTCHVVIIEKQLPVNYRAVRMSQHTLSYFMIHLKNIEPNLAMLFEVKPQLKSRELGAPPNLNERGVKLWAVEKARELLIDRNDHKGLEVLDRKDPITKRKEKKDDLSDTVCQAEALFSYFGWPLTQQVIKLDLNQTNKQIKPEQVISGQVISDQIKPNTVSLNLTSLNNTNIVPLQIVQPLSVSNKSDISKVTLNILG